MKLKAKDFGFVIFQLCLFVMYLLDSPLLFFEAGTFLTSAGIIIAVFGSIMVIISMLQLNTYISPFPSPKSGTSLIQNGLYAYIRHPIYTGILFMGLGYGIFSGSLFKIGVTLVLYVLFYFKSSYEEEQLMLVFKEYPAYKKRTGRFFPKIS